MCVFTVFWLNQRIAALVSRDFSKYELISLKNVSLSFSLYIYSVCVIYIIYP